MSNNEARPYIPVTTWIKSIWEAINKLREDRDANTERIVVLENLSVESKLSRDKINGRLDEKDQQIKNLQESEEIAARKNEREFRRLHERIKHLEQALGDGVYGEYPGGPEARQMVVGLEREQ